MSDHEEYGPLVRLWGVSRAQLPSSAASKTELKALLASMLGEALPFIAGVPPVDEQPSSTSPWRAKGQRAARHGPSPVHLYERTVPSSALREAAQKRHAFSPTAGEDDKEATLPVDAAKITDEAWILRRSVHADAAAPGTASWDEWTRHFKDSHAESERDFTPTVLSTRVEHQWDCAGIEMDGLEPGDPAAVWGRCTLRLEESVHKMPPPLKNRVFPVLQATASVVRGVQGPPRRDFVVVQIALTDQAGEVVGPEGNLVGSYTSIERFRDVNGGIEWTMGTVSHARGVLPAWVQKMSIPGIVAKDVDMFLAWIKEQRKEGAAS